MKGRAGVYASEGQGAVYASSTKAKLDTVSFTETELVVVGEKLPRHIWFRQFRIGQTGNSKEDTLYQDNNSAILLEDNGYFLAGKGSRQIAIRYFFVTDRIKEGEIKVVLSYRGNACRLFAKPLQGALFT